mmetsp:Transcript_8143/g.19987  ORF Transcript_8143/g.19987 Transcript_8143/m.19987 type:complete len:212 (-) Transcript_8143:256-891(-)
MPRHDVHVLAHTGGVLAHDEPVVVVDEPGLDRAPVPRAGLGLGAGVGVAVQARVTAVPPPVRPLPAAAAAAVPRPRPTAAVVVKAAAAAVVEAAAVPPVGRLGRRVARPPVSLVVRGVEVARAPASSARAVRRQRHGVQDREHVELLGHAAQDPARVDDRVKAALRPHLRHRLELGVQDVDLFEEGVDVLLLVGEAHRNGGGCARAVSAAV